MLGWGVKEGLKGRRVTKGRKVVKGGMHSVGRKGYRKGGRKGGGGGGEILCGEGHVIAGLINTYPITPKINSQPSVNTFTTGIVWNQLKTRIPAGVFVEGSDYQKSQWVQPDEGETELP